jgi:predicted RNA-binding protein
MSNANLDSCELTAVDDVRRVREKIALQHRGDLRQHVEETNRVVAQIQARLRIKIVPAPAPDTEGAKVGG